jgi:D-glycero-D-manno-heptose 1,7-bisphosphate phosphatase
MGIGKIVEKGVFLDRDGVINPNIFYQTTGAWESPRCPDEFELFPWVIQSLWRLSESKYRLFLVSNQPSYAKGKTSMDNLKAIQKKLHSILTDNQIYFSEYYYCFHHPQGIIPELAVECDCRKPGTHFLKEAEKAYSLNMSSSWMIGDRDSDIICGRKAGTRTIMVLNKKEAGLRKNSESTPDFKVGSLKEAVDIITSMSNCL